MATSGSYDYSVTASQIITAAFENLGVIAAGGTVATADSNTALQRLNFIAKQFQGNADGMQGMKVWTRQRVAMFLEKSQQTYLIGPASTDSKATTQYGRTTISALEAAAQTVLSITSNTDTTNYPGTTVTMTSGDVIGIVLDTGAIHWSTISGTPSTTATIVDALPSQASSGNYVYWFTSKAQRFPVIESAVLRDQSKADRPINVFRNVREYELGVASKYAAGSPTNVLVEPLRLNTRITVDSQPTNVKEQLIFTVLYPAEDYDSTSNDIAFPQEWFAALEWELTFRLCPAYGVQWTPEMEKNHNNALSIARAMNPEVSDLYFQPNA